MELPLGGLDGLVVPEGVASRAQEQELARAQVVIAVAGMEGALPSVVAGLVPCPVIGVPTSVGYGAAFGGLTALMAMLTSCAGGLVVVNIDNGLGAALAADLMVRRKPGKQGKSKNSP